MRGKYLIAVILYLFIPSVSFGEGQQPFDVHAPIKNIDSTLQTSIQSGQYGILISNLILRGIPVNCELKTKYDETYLYKDEKGETQIIPDVTMEFTRLVKGYNALNILKHYSEPCGYNVELKNDRLFSFPKEQRLTSASIQIPAFNEKSITFSDLFVKYIEPVQQHLGTDLIDGSCYMLIIGYVNTDDKKIPKPIGHYEFSIEFQGGSLQDLLWVVLDRLEAKYNDCFFCWWINRINDDVYVHLGMIEKYHSEELFTTSAQ